MTASEEDCQKGAGYAIPIFLLRLICAVFFGITYRITLAFITIPVAFLQSVTICCLECDKKGAKNKIGLQYLGLQATYLVMAFMAISQTEDSEKALK